jgi:hypothetical protein
MCQLTGSKSRLSNNTKFKYYIAGIGYSVVQYRTKNMGRFKI